MGSISVGSSLEWAVDFLELCLVFGIVLFVFSCSFANAEVRTAHQYTSYHSPIARPLNLRHNAPDMMPISG